MAPKENTLILIKEYGFVIEKLSVEGCAEIFTPDVHLEGMAGSECPKTKAIWKYFHDRSDRSLNETNRKGHILFLFMNLLRDDKQCFYANKSIMKYLRELLPDAFLELRIVRGEASNEEEGEEEDPFNKAEMLVLEKRFLLKYMLYPEREGARNLLVAMSIPFKNDLPRKKPLLCRLTLGWKAPAKRTQMCTTTLMEKLFEDESSKDLTILAGNGAEVKCHQLVFTAQTPAFSAMLSAKTGMTEAQSKRVEMRENSEEGIRYLVQYLYGLELVIGDMTSDVALELFQTAHKYELSQLEGSLLELFLQEDMDWYSPDVVLEMYFYVRNVDVFEKLREHTLFLVASMPMEKLRSCEVYGKLGRAEEVDLLLKLVDYLKKPDFHKLTIPQVETDDNGGEEKN